jgi:hypothetical protein
MLRPCSRCLPRTRSIRGVRGGWREYHLSIAPAKASLGLPVFDQHRLGELVVGWRRLGGLVEREGLARRELAEIDVPNCGFSLQISTSISTSIMRRAAGGWRDRRGSLAVPNTMIKPACYSSTSPKRAGPTATARSTIRDHAQLTRTPPITPGPLRWNHNPAGWAEVILRVLDRFR